MTEVEKLYNNAGIEYGSCQNYSRLEECCNSTFCYSGMCPCGIGGKKNPFTAEKQLELIKWSARREPKIEIGYSSVYGYWVENPTDTRYYFEDQFDNALASLINILWQDLTEEEKRQIKEILRR